MYRSVPDSLAQLFDLCRDEADCALRTNDPIRVRAILGIVNAVLAVIDDYAFLLAAMNRAAMRDADIASPVSRGVWLSTNLSDAKF